MTGPYQNDEPMSPLLPEAAMVQGSAIVAAPAPMDVGGEETSRMLDPKKSTLSSDQSSQNDEEEDPISSAIGQYGRWQLLITFLLSLFNIPCTWHIFVPTFHAAARDYWCAAPEHLIGLDSQVWREYSQPEGPCTILDIPWSSVTPEMVLQGKAPNASLTECTHWSWDGEGDTVVSEWSLVCERKQLNNIAEMVFLGGVALGGLVSGVISDKYGRKRTLMASVFLQTIIGVMISFSPWFCMYLILRTLLGFISVGVVFSGFVLSLEVVGGVWRTVAGVSYLFPVSFSYVSIAGIAWLLRKWRHLQLAVSLPGGMLLLLWFVLPESPRWLLALGRKTEVLAILQRAAAFNGKPLPPGTDKRLMPVSSSENQDKAASAGLLDLFRTRKMRNNSFCLFIIWFSVYIVYYGLVLNVGNIGGDLYINSVLSGIVEIPAIAVSILFLVRMGRRWPLCLTLILSGVACLGTLAIPPRVEGAGPDLQWLTTAFAMLGKFSVSSSNAVMPVFTAELYPTVIRNLGVGASNVSAGIALMLVPYLWNLSAMHNCVPMAVLGACGIFGGLCVLYLPETGNRPLAGTLNEPQSTANGKNHVSSVTENHHHLDSGIV
ncbi:uncharacterized protein CBL_07601 [Carabus blaptoides fortunei]